MYGVSKITSEQDILLTTFPGAQYSARSLADHLEVFAKAGIVLDMICQSAPRGAEVDFSFTTGYQNFAAVMAALPEAARALQALAEVGVEIALITTSDLDISLLVRQQDEDTALAALRRAFAL